MGGVSFARRCYKLISALAVVVLLGANAAAASEWVLETRDLLVRRHFQSFTISASASVFFDTTTPWGETLPDTEIRDETRRLFASRLKLVDNPAEAQYDLKIRLEEYTDYATRNSKGLPATGFVFFSICVLPIKETSESCQHLMFYYFEGQPHLAIFRRAAKAWLDLVIR